MSGHRHLSATCPIPMPPLVEAHSSVDLETISAWLVRPGDQVRRLNAGSWDGTHRQAVFLDEVKDIRGVKRAAGGASLKVQFEYEPCNVYWWPNTMVDVVKPELPEQIGPAALMERQMASARRAVVRIERARAATELKSIIEAL